MAIAFTFKSAQFSTTASTVYTGTTAWTPQANALQIAFVCGCSTATAVDPTSVSGHGLTWTKISGTNLVFGSAYTPSVWVSKTSASAGTSGSASANFANSKTGGVIVQYEVTGIDLDVTSTGNVVEITTSTGTGTAGTATLTGPTRTTNRPIAFYVHAANEATTPKSGWTEDSGADGNFANPATGAEVQWIASAYETGSSATWTTSSAWRSFALQILAPAVTKTYTVVSNDTKVKGTATVTRVRIRPYTVVPASFKAAGTASKARARVYAVTAAGAKLAGIGTTAHYRQFSPVVGVNDVKLRGASSQTKTKVGTVAAQDVRTAGTATLAKVKVAPARTRVTYFTSGFETGNLSDWTSEVDPDGYLNVDSAQARDTYSAHINIVSGGNDISLEKAGIASGRNARASFWIYAPTGTADPDELLFLYGADDYSVKIAQVYYSVIGGLLRLSFRAWVDAGTYQASSAYTFALDQWHHVELLVTTSSAPGADNGTIELRVDGQSKEIISGLDNDVVAQTVAVLWFDLGYATGVNFYIDDVSVYCDPIVTQDIRAAGTATVARSTVEEYTVVTQDLKLSGAATCARERVYPYTVIPSDVRLAGAAEAAYQEPAAAPLMAERMLRLILNMDVDYENLNLRLFQNDITPSSTMNSTAFDEASFTGYSAVTLSSEGWGIVAGEPTYAYYSSGVPFTCSATTSQGIYGFYLTGVNTSTVMWAERFPAAPYPITWPNDSLAPRPRLELECADAT